jgi:23S rRNA (uracil1939-C5)-methyltransferase
VRAAGGLNAGEDSCFHFAGGTSILNEVRIEKWVYGGDGLARVAPGQLSEDAQGGESAHRSLTVAAQKEETVPSQKDPEHRLKPVPPEGARRVVLVPYVLPGEVASIEVGEDVHAALANVIEPSPDRVTPPCRYFARCGGCHYQHAPYEFQLARKVEILREQLRRVGKIDFEGEIDVVSGPPLGYRNRAQFHVENGRIGYRAARSHELIDVAECPISSPRINEILKLLRERIHDPRFPRFVHSIEVFSNETDVQINATEADRPVARTFYEWMGSTVALDYSTSFGTFRVSPRSFFQVNRFLVEQLVEHAIGDATGETALDLYAGVGLFSIPLARRFQKVVAVESGSAAIRDLEVNAERANVPVGGEQAQVEDFLMRFDKKPDFVLADPPRAGLGKSVVASLNRMRPPRLTIVSCDPATLARDLAGLTAYRIDRLTMIDLFPQTYHLETIAHLRLGSEDNG